MTISENRLVRSSGCVACDGYSATCTGGSVSRTFHPPPPGRSTTRKVSRRGRGGSAAVTGLTTPAVKIRAIGRKNCSDRAWVSIIGCPDANSSAVDRFASRQLGLRSASRVRRAGAGNGGRTAKCLARSPGNEGQGHVPGRTSPERCRWNRSPAQDSFRCVKSGEIRIRGTAVITGTIVSGRSKGSSLLMQLSRFDRVSRTIARAVRGVMSRSFRNATLPVRPAVERNS